jgi:nodulation protein A
VHSAAGCARQTDAVIELRWVLRWEADLTEDDHGALHALLLRGFAASPSSFARGRSWSSARPEGRLIGYGDDGPVAHLGFLRRTLRVEDDDAAQLVADAGLVCVDPALHRAGVGRQLLEQTAAAFRRLAVPFGFLTCGPHVVPFYEAGGWRQLPGQVTRMIDKDGRPERYTGPAMLLPVTSTIDDWPHGRTVVRDGYEV